MLDLIGLCRASKFPSRRNSVANTSGNSVTRAVSRLRKILYAIVETCKTSIGSMLILVCVHHNQRLILHRQSHRELLNSLYCNSRYISNGRRVEPFLWLGRRSILHYVLQGCSVVRTDGARGSNRMGRERGSHAPCTVSCTDKTTLGRGKEVRVRNPEAKYK